MGRKRDLTVDRPKKGPGKKAKKQKPPELPKHLKEEGNFVDKLSYAGTDNRGYFGISRYPFITSLINLIFTSFVEEPYC